MSAAPEIPIANVYHLLCYAWGYWGFEADAEVERDDHSGYTALLLNVLNHGCTHLLKQGLHRDYRAETESMPAIRGKLELSQSLATGRLAQGIAVCTYDVFTADVLANQILKSVLLRYAGLPGLEKKLADASRRVALRMSEVSRIEVDIRLFNRVKLHRNNAYYGFLLFLCRLLVESLSVRELQEDWETVEQRFHRSLSEKLPALFEAFVRNFYRTHLGREGWSRFDAQHIDWQWTPLNSGASGLLPKMKTDVTLEHPDRKIILDTKFYRSGGLSEHFERLTFESANLYQLHAYVTQLSRQAENRASSGDRLAHPHDRDAEGMLLYASTREEEFLHAYWMAPHRMVVASVDLARPWRDIEARLLDLIRPAAPAA